MSKGLLYLVERIDGKELCVFQTRHEASGYISTLRAGKREWYDIKTLSPLSLLHWKPRVTGDEWKPHPGYPATEVES